MTDDLELRLKDLLEDRGRPDPASVAGLLGGVDVLPTRRPRVAIPALAAVVAIALISLVGVVALGLPGGRGGQAVPPDPAAFAGDPRMDACFAGAGEVEAAFEMRQARDYRRHLPRMLRAPELEVDDPGFVVVFAGDVSLGGVGPRPATGKYVCILVADTPNVYEGVDTDGMLPFLPDGSLDPTPASSTAVPTPTEAAVASPTVAPAPWWVGDLAGQLDCDGPIAAVGDEVAVNAAPMEPAPTPDDALETLLSAGDYAWLPAGGFEAAQTEGPWALHRYVVSGRLKAVAVSTNRYLGIPDDVGWEVVGLRACDPSEFDPADGLTDETTLWLDADGRRVPATRVFSRLGPAHCGWEDVTFLHYEEKLYLRDVDGVLADQTAGSFRTVDTLPADAVDTGLHTSEWQLSTVPDERFIYLRTADDAIERWARANDEIGCA